MPNPRSKNTNPKPLGFLLFGKAREEKKKKKKKETKCQNPRSKSQNPKLLILKPIKFEGRENKRRKTKSFTPTSLTTTFLVCS